MLARSKLNSIESKMSESLISNEINHENFMTIINEQRNYREVKESIRIIKGERSKIECTSIAEDKKIDID